MFEEIPGYYFIAVIIVLIVVLMWAGVVPTPEFLKFGDSKAKAVGGNVVDEDEPENDLTKSEVEAAMALLNRSSGNTSTQDVDYTIDDLRDVRGMRVRDEATVALASRSLGDSTNIGGKDIFGNELSGEAESMCGATPHEGMATVDKSELEKPYEGFSSAAYAGVADDFETSAAKVALGDEYNALENDQANWSGTVNRQRTNTPMLESNVEPNVRVGLSRVNYSAIPNVGNTESVQSVYNDQLQGTAGDNGYHIMGAASWNRP